MLLSSARQVLHAQQELLLRDQRDEAARHDASSKYADEVRRQIREKEQLRIAERNAFFEEGIKLDEEARLRRQKLDDIKKKKLDALRSVRVRVTSSRLLWCRLVHVFDVHCIMCKSDNVEQIVHM